MSRPDKIGCWTVAAGPHNVPKNQKRPSILRAKKTMPQPAAKGRSCEAWFDHTPRKYEADIDAAFKVMDPEGQDASSFREAFTLGNEDYVELMLALDTMKSRGRDRSTRGNHGVGGSCPGKGRGRGNIRPK